jgi:hypothetical protein
MGDTLSIVPTCLTSKSSRPYTNSGTHTRLIPPSLEKSEDWSNGIVSGDWCNIKAQEKKAKETKFRLALSMAQERLHRSPQCRLLQQEVNSIEDKLKDHEQWRAKRQKMRSRGQWRNLWDKGSKEFYRNIQPRTIKTNIIELLDVNDQPKSSQSEMEGICHTCYSKQTPNGAQRPTRWLTPIPSSAAASLVSTPRCKQLSTCL